MRYLLIPLILLVAVGIANAQDFHVSVLNGKLHPGDHTNLVILVEYEGRAENFVLNENTSNLLTLITTAKDLRVEMEDEWIPIKVENENPQIVGDLPSGRVAKVVFRVRVDEDAEMGEYRVPIKLKYTKVRVTQTPSGVLLSYSDEVDVEYVKVNVTRRDYDFSVLKVESSLEVGREGAVEVTLKNTGRFEIHNATLTLKASPPLKPNPKATTTYLGDLDVDETASAKFKVYVMEGALNQSYPAELILSFRTSDNVRMVVSKTVGLKVENRDLFYVEKVEELLTSPKGLKKPVVGFLKVEIENLGKDVRDAVAILSFDSPLLKAENTPYVGNLKKGEKRVVTFYVESLAPRGYYRGCVVLKYRNGLGDEVLSGKHYVEVKVDSSPLRVVRVESNLAVGMSGDLNVYVKNNLKSDLENVEFSIVPTKFAVPLSTTYYLEKLGPSKVEVVKFRVRVSSEVASGSYKLYMIERYDLSNAEGLTSVVEIPVLIKSRRAYFEVVSVKSDLYPDKTGYVFVEIRNVGNLTAYNCVVELSVSNPLTIAGTSSLASLMGKSQPGLYFVGTLKPGEVAIAKFKVDVDKDACSGYYPATVRVRYDDFEGYTHESNPVTVSLEVKEVPLINPVTITATVLIAVAVFAGLKFGRRRLK